MSLIVSQSTLEDTIDLLSKRNLLLSLENLELKRNLRKARATVHQLRLQRKRLDRTVKELNKMPMFATCDVSFDYFGNMVENPNK